MALLHDGGLWRTVHLDCLVFKPKYDAKMRRAQVDSRKIRLKMVELGLPAGRQVE